MATKTGKHAEFKQMGDLFILKREANHKKSMKLLARNGLRPLTSQEALYHIKTLSRLAEARYRKGFEFYLAGEGTRMDGTYTFNKRANKFTLYNGIHDPRTVTFLPGRYQLRFNPGTDASEIIAYEKPSFPADVVVGVRASLKSAVRK